MRLRNPIAESVRRRGATLVAMFFINVAWSSPLLASLTLDQSHVLSQSVGGLISVTEFTPAQTFTAGRNGLLSQVDVQIHRNVAALGDATLEVWQTMGAGPIGTSPLYSRQIPNSAIPLSSSNIPFTSVDVSGGGIQIAAGSTYAIALRTPQTFDDPVIAWRWGYPGYAGGDPYSTAFGRPWEAEASDVDFAFKTWVAPPPRTGPLGPSYRLLESAKAPTPPQPGLPLLGIPVDDTYFVGVNFEIEKSTHIKRVGGNFIGSDTGQVFAAIVRLDSINGAPNPPNLSGSDVVGHALVNLPGPGTTIADVSAPLDLTLEPGFYGLWFGSGRFGATGEGTLYAQNPDLGSWYGWTQPLPSGSRGFDDNRTRMFLDAASAPGTVQVRATQDAAAVRSGASYLVTEQSESVTSVWNSPSQSRDERAIFEFDLRGVPAGATIESVTIELDFKGRQGGSGGQLPLIHFHGYAGDGTITTADASRPANDIGVSPPVELTVLSTELNAAYVQSLLGVSTHLGLLGIGDVNGLRAQFDGSETRNSIALPLLTIEYSMQSDFNEDGFVDGDDLEEWKTAFGQTAQGDADRDGDTDGADFLNWQLQISGAANTMIASSTVPEPATLWGAGVTAGLVGAVMHRRRRSGALFRLANRAPGYESTKASARNWCVRQKHVAGEDGEQDAVGPA
jgi:hypothetical protein